ncbi:hemin ABC transporter substrate-binding protein [Bordetella sp. BOR01]|uniref:heme/hemin ABC transporter substrate-binding protein n=1 Tax=Bordetella sp. BOR01 TaxID=2854779 RepID=UPI001C463EB2|nr:hemin ABC transporter substrate-binding protein [Bordetella sp. BOR01]MBV7483072.1 hemin ABC transporter substrate-binding protein [Bordetella sp. BOR01]
MAASLLRTVGAVLAAACVAASAQAAQDAPAARVVSLGGTVTEIVYALDQGDRLVGDDLSSLYPEAATKLPRVGYYRAVPVEGVLALRPDLVLASDQAGPPTAIARLKEVGVPVAVVSDQPTVQSLDDRIRQIAQALGVPERGEQLAGSVDAALRDARALPESHARAVLIMNRTGTPLGAGSGTAASLVMELSGLVNVLADQQGYKPLSAEALGGLAPQVIVVPRMSLEAAGGMQKLLAMPGVASTPAAANDCIVVMDDLLALGTGPRLPQAIRALKETDCVARQGQPSRAAS